MTTTYVLKLDNVLVVHGLEQLSLLLELLDSLLVKSLTLDHLLKQKEVKRCVSHNSIAISINVP